MCANTVVYTTSVRTIELWILHTGRITLKKLEKDKYSHHRPSRQNKSIFHLHLVKWASVSWLDGSKWLEMQKMQLLSGNFYTDCVITLGDLGNCEVDQIFHIYGLKSCILLTPVAKIQTGPLFWALESTPPTQKWVPHPVRIGCSVRRVCPKTTCTTRV